MRLPHQEQRRAERRTGDGDWLKAGDSYFFRMWFATRKDGDRRLHPGRREGDDRRAHLRIALKSLMSLQRDDMTAVLEELGYHEDRAASRQSPLEARP